ncbi:MAG: glycosyltransferase family 4 protein [bacterium]|nr:glycosyltransferase family 4 protein [bacterium]
MKVTFLTWEFPPFISGGLGMACYGLARALLEQGVEVDMMLPTREEVYFPLRTAQDVDHLPITFFNPQKQEAWTKKQWSSLKERLHFVGLSTTPESYLTPGFHFGKIFELLPFLSEATSWEFVQRIRPCLEEGGSFFQKIQEFTELVVRNAPSLGGDLIHAHDWMTYPAAMILSRLTGRPFVAHVHATEFDRAGGNGDERIHQIEYAGLTMAHRVMAVSQYTAKILEDRYRIDPAKIQVVHNAYSMEEGRFKRSSLFRDPLILFLGRVTLQKGPDYFLEIADRVLKEYPKARFVMGGVGDMFQRILHSAAARRLR